MKWKDCESSIEIYPPLPFNYEECLLFLGRSEQEVLYEISQGVVWKLLRVSGERVLLKISHQSNALRVEFPIRPPSLEARQEIAAYIWEWFDLEADLNAFYQMAVE
ncbi:MAG: DNA-3-methyladenine glycosylase, partial [Paenisporosarcina sp.]|nr:DNA-3-methyladenine glycosylase [Paenisporosarcina sp.]